MVCTGVFDRYSRLRLILGHCGEMLPFMLDRIDAMLPVGSMALKPSEYFRRNIWVTTSGLFSLPPSVAAVDGPSSRISRATCPRVGAAPAGPGRLGLSADRTFFTTILCRK